MSGWYLSYGKLDNNIMKWKRIEESSIYNCYAKSDINLFQTWEWGDFKKRHGWTPIRYSAFDTNDINISSVQILQKKIFGIFSILWISGYRFESEKLLSTFLETLKKDFPIFYLRLYSMQPLTSINSYCVSKHLYKPCVFVNSGFSVFLNLEKKHEQWMSSLSKKHRYSVKQSKKIDINWSFGESDKLISDFCDLLSELEQMKGSVSFGYSKEDYIKLRKLTGESLKILVGYDVDVGQPITGCVVLLDRKQAYYMSAATNKAGRSVSASYAMIDELRVRLSSEKITMMDFGGVAPDSISASGVNHFKTGFNGEIIQYLGEWDFGSWLTRVVGNFVVMVKKI